MSRNILKLILVCIIFSPFSSCFKGETIIIIPKLKFSATTLSFNDNETKSLYITLEHASVSEYQITESPSWLSITPTNGMLTGNLHEVIISSKLEDFPEGIYQGNIVFFSNLGIDSIKVSGTAGKKLFLILPDTLDMPLWENERSLKIKNNTDTPIIYSTSISNNYLTVEPDSGSFSQGVETEILIKVNREHLQHGLNFSNIIFDLNGLKDTIKVQINHVVQLKKLLNSDIIDAAYHKQMNQLIWVSSEPRSANLYDTAQDFYYSIPLQYTPSCVAISLDGTKAVVGHDAYISYIDLINQVVIKTITVPVYAFDIILSGSQVVIVPKDGQSTRLICVNLENDEVKEHTGELVRNKSKMILHPSGNFAYLCDAEVSPVDIRKIDLRTFPARYMYDSPYHGTHPIGAQIWVSGTGDKLYTEFGTTFRATTNQATDMIYAGKLNIGDFNKIQCLDHSMERNELFLIITAPQWTTNAANSVDIFDDNNYAFKSSLNLEEYLGRDASGELRIHSPTPLFVFSNSQGSKIFVLMKDGNDPFDAKWALQTINR